MHGGAAMFVFVIVFLFSFDTIRGSEDEPTGPIGGGETTTPGTHGDDPDDDGGGVGGVGGERTTDPADPPLGHGDPSPGADPAVQPVAGLGAAGGNTTTPDDPSSDVGDAPLPGDGSVPPTDPPTRGTSAAADNSDASVLKRLERCTVDVEVIVGNDVRARGRGFVIDDKARVITTHLIGKEERRDQRPKDAWFRVTFHPSLARGTSESSYRYAMHSELLPRGIDPLHQLAVLEPSGPVLRHMRLDFAPSIPDVAADNTNRAKTFEWAPDYFHGPSGRRLFVVHTAGERSRNVPVVCVTKISRLRPRGRSRIRAAPYSTELWPANDSAEDERFIAIAPDDPTGTLVWQDLRGAPIADRRGVWGVCLGVAASYDSRYLLGQWAFNAESRLRERDRAAQQKARGDGARRSNERPR